MNKGSENADIIASAVLITKYKILKMGIKKIESDCQWSYISAIKFFQLNKGGPKYFLLMSALIIFIISSGYIFHFKIFEYSVCGFSLIISVAYLCAYFIDKGKFQNALRVYNTAAEIRKKAVLDQLSEARANDL